MNNMHNFGEAKKRAIDELYEMNKKAAENTDFARQETAHPPINNSKNIFKTFNLSLGDDELIVFGLILILSKDCHDTWLFLALLYILL